MNDGAKWMDVDPNADIDELRAAYKNNVVYRGDVPDCRAYVVDEYGCYITGGGDYVNAEGDMVCLGCRKPGWEVDIIHVVSVSSNFTPGYCTTCQADKFFKKLGAVVGVGIFLFGVIGIVEQVLTTGGG